MTLQKKIRWNLDYKKILLRSDNQTPNLPPDIEHVFSTLVDEKIFRLIGVLNLIDAEIKSVKLQLWNNENDIQEYEFPDHPSFKELFQLVRELEIKKNKFYVAQEAENFVDKLLKKSYTSGIPR
ncbi:MAG: hypothetical protein LBP87_02045 [Planctomycetaceae bacterium]|jgi:hypothetical protein|nr:hypothetical protein [Planctomycetaceae bacterium]